MKTIDTSNFPVMAHQCSSCPFRTDKKGRNLTPELASKIMVQVMTEASQICHHPRLHNKEETHLCRGARDYQMMVFHRLGVIDAPTDEAWNRTLDRIKEGRNT